MFDFVQNNRVIISIIVGIVALTLVLGFGVSSYYNSTPNESYVIKVGNAGVTQSDIDEAMRNQQQPVDEKQRAEIIDSLVQRQLLLQEAKRVGIVISADQVRNAISQLPMLQENGSFSQEKYKAFLSNYHMTSDQFEQEIKQQLMIEVLLAPMTVAHLIPSLQTRVISQIFNGERTLRVAMYPAKAFTDQVKLSDEVLKKYYNENTKHFRSSEAVKVQFVILSLSKLAQQIQISDEEAKKYFDLNRDKFAKRRISHILLSVPSDATAKAKTKVKTQAEALQKELQGFPDKFAQIAKEKSQDPGSAADGGNLGEVEKNGLFVKSFEDAAFALTKPGQISGVVETEFGFHIIKLDDISEPSFDSAKEKIVATLRAQKAEQEYKDKAKQLAELAYNNKDSLAKVESTLKLKVEESDWIEKNRSADPIFSDPKVLTQIFSDDLLNKKQNSEPIILGPDLRMVVRVLEHRPEKQLSFDEVKPVITMDLQNQEANKLAAKQGQAALKSLQANKPAEVKWEEVEFKLGRDQPPPQGLMPQDLQKIYAVSTKKLPAYGGFSLTNRSGYVLFKIKSYTPAKPLDENEQRQFATGLAQGNFQSTFEGLLETLKSRYPVVKMKDKSFSSK